MDFFEIEKLKYLTEKYWKKTSPYISYPPLTEYKDLLSNESYMNFVGSNSSELFSLYIHIPYCESFCYFCACRTIITNKREVADTYIAYLIKEMKAKSVFFKNKIVNKIHIGGGTPNFLTADQMERLLYAIHYQFKIKEEIEKVIEIDPNFISQDQLSILQKYKFNRASLGFQDGNPHVQEAINRVVSVKKLNESVADLYSTGFSSINIDIIYGLPMQSRQDFLNTVSIVHSSGANRIWMTRYIHDPGMFRGQRKIKSPVLASAFEINMMYAEAYEFLTNIGFRNFAMEYFVNDSENWMPESSRNVYRNITGFSKSEESLLGLGLFSISEFNGAFFKNNNLLKEYYEDIENNRFFEKMYISNKDDIVRREVIRSFQVGQTVFFDDIYTKFNVKFSAYFENEINFLKKMAEDGLISIDDEHIEIKYYCYPFIRVLCSIFDNISNKKK